MRANFAFPGAIMGSSALELQLEHKSAIKFHTNGEWVATQA